MKKINSYKRLLRARTTRMWVQSDERIHALNYWFYRYFTHRYTDYLLRIYDMALGESSLNSQVQEQNNSETSKKEVESK